jgi:hypothetical protein
MFVPSLSLQNRILGFHRHNQLFKTNVCVFFLLFAGPEGLDANPTVGGIHSSDLGQYEIADFYVGFLPSVMAASRHNTSTYE